MIMIQKDKILKIKNRNFLIYFLYAITLLKVIFCLRKYNHSLVKIYWEISEIGRG